MTKKQSIPLSEFLRSFESKLTPEFVTLPDEKSILTKISTLCAALDGHRGSFILNESEYSDAVASSHSIFFYSPEYRNPDLLLFDPIVDIKYNESLKEYRIFSYPDVCTLLILKDALNDETNEASKQI